MSASQDDGIWIERLSRHGEVLERQRFTQLPIHLGRGYGADWMLDDAHIAALHLRIARDEDSGQLIAEDLGSKNGLLGTDGKAHQRIMLDGQQSFRIGHTRLRVREAGFAVAPEASLQRKPHPWPWSAALTTALCLLTLLQTWLSQTQEPEFHTFIYAVMPLLLVAVGIAAVWAVLNRVFAGTAQFAAHLRVVLVTLLFTMGFEAVVAAVSYSLSWGWLAYYGDFAQWLIFAAWLFGHLRLIGRGGQGLKLTAIGLLSVLGIGWSALAQSQLQEHSGASMLVKNLLPPSLRLAAPSEEDEFFKQLDALRPKLEEERRKPLSKGEPDWFE